MDNKSEPTKSATKESRSDEHSETQNLKVVKKPLEIEDSEGFDPYDTARLHVRKNGTD